MSERIGEGIFQVQQRQFIEHHGPCGMWFLERRFHKLSEAEEYCRVTPTNWTERRIFVEPKEVPDGQA